MTSEILFSGAVCIAERIERMIEAMAVSFDSALYRFNNARLANALADAIQCGVRVRQFGSGSAISMSDLLWRSVPSGRFCSGPGSVAFSGGVYRLPRLRSIEKETGGGNRKVALRV